MFRVWERPRLNEGRGMLGPLGFEGWGNAHLGVEGHEGDAGHASQDGWIVHHERSSLHFRVSSIFNSTFVFGSRLGRNGFLPTPFAEAVWVAPRSPSMGPDRGIGVSDVPRTDSLGNECDFLPVVSNLEDPADY